MSVQPVYAEQSSAWPLPPSASPLWPYCLAYDASGLAAWIVTSLCQKTLLATSLHCACSRMRIRGRSIRIPLSSALKTRHPIESRSCHSSQCVRLAVLAAVFPSEFNFVLSGRVRKWESIARPSTSPFSRAASTSVTFQAQSRTQYPRSARMFGGP